MSAQFISRNHFFFCKRGWESHFKQTKSVNNQVSMENYKNFRNFDLRIVLVTVTKYFYLFKKIFTN